jgi:hypothetical protein
MWTTVDAANLHELGERIVLSRWQSPVERCLPSSSVVWLHQGWLEAEGLQLARHHVLACQLCFMKGTVQQPDLAFERHVLVLQLRDLWVSFLWQCGSQSFDLMLETFNVPFDSGSSRPLVFSVLQPLPGSSFVCHAGGWNKAY